MGPDPCSQQQKDPESLEEILEEEYQGGSDDTLSHDLNKVEQVISRTYDNVHHIHQRLCDQENDGHVHVSDLV